MSKKQKFINFINDLLKNVNITDMDEDVKTYWEAFISSDNNKDKPEFTEKGKMVLDFLVNNQDKNNWKSKDIAEALNISARTISGAMRKLANDGYVEKLGQDPIIYCLTEKGKNIKF